VRVEGWSGEGDVVALNIRCGVNDCEDSRGWIDGDVWDLIWRSFEEGWVVWFDVD